MEKDHTSWMQQTPLPNQAQLIEHGVPIVISIDKDAVVSAGKIRERIEAVALIDRHPRIAGVPENKVRVEAGIVCEISGSFRISSVLRPVLAPISQKFFQLCFRASGTIQSRTKSCICPSSR